MKRTFWALALITGACGTSSAGELEFDPANGLPIRMGDRVVVQEEDLPPLARESDLREVRGDQVYSQLGDSLRKEFAEVDGRLEYTFEFHLPAAPGKLSYSLLVPLPKGAKARVTHENYRFTTTTDVVVGESRERFAPARFVTVETDGGGFAIDLDPVGVWQDSSDFDKVMRVSNAIMADEGIRLLFERGTNEWGGGRIRAKLVVYPEPVPFEDIHPFHHASWKSPLETLYFLDFTNGKRAKPPVATAVDRFDAERGYGWLDPSADLRIVDRKGKGHLHSGFATSPQPATFRMKAPAGDYLLTVVVGDLEQSVGPMRVEVNGTAPLEFRTAPAGFKSETTVVSTEDGVIDLRLQGDPWVLNGVALQPLMLAHEDYQRRMPWWRHTISSSDREVESSP